MCGVVGGGARRIADQRWDVDFYEGEVVEIEAPCPYTCGLAVSVQRMLSLRLKWKMETTHP